MDSWNISVRSNISHNRYIHESSDKRIIILSDDKINSSDIVYERYSSDRWDSRDTSESSDISDSRYKSEIIYLVRTHAKFF